MQIAWALVVLPFAGFQFFFRARSRQRTHRRCLCRLPVRKRCPPGPSALGVVV